MSLNMWKRRKLLLLHYILNGYKPGPLSIDMLIYPRDSRQSLVVRSANPITTRSFNSNRRLNKSVSYLDIDQEYYSGS